MAAGVFLALLAALGLGAAVAASSEKKESPWDANIDTASKERCKWLLQNEKNPATLRAEAAAMRARGYPKAAELLERQAANLENPTNRPPPGSPPAGAPPGGAPPGGAPPGGAPPLASIPAQLPQLEPMTPALFKEMSYKYGQENDPSTLRALASGLYYVGFPRTAQAFETKAGGIERSFNLPAGVTPPHPQKWDAGIQPSEAAWETGLQSTIQPGDLDIGANNAKNAGYPLAAQTFAARAYTIRVAEQGPYTQTQQPNPTTILQTILNPQGGPPAPPGGMPSGPPVPPSSAPPGGPPPIVPPVGPGGSAPPSGPPGGKPPWIGPGGAPPGGAPPGVPPGVIPPWMVPPGVIPPGMVPPGGLPGSLPGSLPGVIPPGGAPPPGTKPDPSFYGLPKAAWVNEDRVVAYVYQPNDVGMTIAKKFLGSKATWTDVQALVKENPGRKWNMMMAGMDVLIPKYWFTLPPTAVTTTRPGPPAPSSEAQAAAVKKAAQAAKPPAKPAAAPAAKK